MFDLALRHLCNFPPFCCGPISREAPNRERRLFEILNIQGKETLTLRTFHIDQKLLMTLSINSKHFIKEKSSYKFIIRSISSFSHSLSEILRSLSENGA